MKNKKILLPVIALLVIVGAYFAFGTATSDPDSDILVAAKKGVFQVDITTTGELEAKNSVRIQGPSGLRNANIYQVKIDRIINEGVVVKKGEYIATLDQSELASKISNAMTELDKAQSQYTQARLDSALTLRQARDELVNLRFATTEKQIILEQSKFEPPATIKQAQIDVEKSQRALKQASENYKLKRNQAVAKMQEISATLQKTERQLQELTDLQKQFTITAPEDGMLIYDREWNGQRKKTGSSISAWDPVVATLPDLTVMLSKTYVNEVDIRKVKVGQFVKIGLDAYPEKKLTGKVMTVANVGEQKPNSDAKVFEVSVQVAETDTTLRPAMTTSNSIIAEVVENVVYVPLESLQNQGDSLVYVFKKVGTKTVRQEVEAGKTNSNEVIIVRGVDEGEMVYISQPKQPEAAGDIVLLEWKNGRKAKPLDPAAETNPNLAQGTNPAPGSAAGPAKSQR
jgi:HlyD family secretion protein